TCRATGDLTRIRDLVFLHEPLADPEVVRGTLVRHVEDLIFRPHVLRWIAMALQAPAHLKAVLLIHERHAVDASVTRRAADALDDVDAVVEVHEVGQIVDARPLERAVLPEAGANGFENRRVGPDLRMAVHAG